MTDLQSPTASGWKYTLTGFGEFLEMRRVAFAEPMPATCVCGVCGVLSYRTALLPCGHVFCENCKSQLLLGNDRCCPFDGREFADSDIKLIKVCELQQLRIVCSASSRVCGFSGKLTELAFHLRQCGGGKVKCCKCERPVFRGHAVNHYRSCTGPPHAANAGAAANGDNMADVEKSARELMLIKGVDLEAVLSRFTNTLADKIASLERQLLEAQNRSNSNRQPAVDTEKVIQGPYRAASRAGVLITTCKFAEVRAALDSLNEKKTQVVIPTATYSLGGYTFCLACMFSKSGSAIHADFALFLRDGEWDSYVEWPFKNKVTLIIMHPKDAAKDVRLPVTMTEHEMVKKPSVDSWNSSCYADCSMNWNDIELRGYVDRGALYVNVEFE